MTRPLHPHRLAQAMRDDDMLAAINARLAGDDFPEQVAPPHPALDLAEWLQRHDYRPPSTFERIADALGSRVGLAFYCGAYVGALLTVALAWVWSRAI